MSYKLFTDKINKFQCSLQVEGTSLSKSEARVILEMNDISYLFRGKIYDTGVCEFNLPKLKGILNEGDKGLLRLEVIADDVHFEPWSSDFIIQVDKKVNVIVQEQIDEKPKISIGNINLMEYEEPKVVSEPKKISSKVVLTKEEIMKRRRTT